jgi:hypothetical protein
MRPAAQLFWMVLLTTPIDESSMMALHHRHTPTAAD